MTAIAIEPPAAETALLERTARSMTTAGATLTGEQRRGLAVRSRSLTGGGLGDGGGDTTASPPPPSASDPLDELTHRLTVAPASLRQGFVRELEEVGIPSSTYVETLGLVARLTAVDTFAFGLGLDPVALPPATDEPPTGEVADEATIDGGWIPTVGPASPPTALSLVPGEHRAMHDLHGVFYLSIPDMADLDAERGLHRTQMELVAARTSLLNECFF